MEKKIENGYEITILDSGHVIKTPVQDPNAKTVEPVETEIDIDLITDKDFKRLVLEKLGVKVKQ